VIEERSLGQLVEVGGQVHVLTRAGSTDIQMGNAARADACPSGT
jgi:hypothetical protein